MDYRVSTNYAIQGQGSLGYASDYRTGASGSLNMALISSADPMKGGLMDDDEEPGCCSQCCRWVMIATTAVMVIAIMVLAIEYKDCHDLPVLGRKFGCGAPPPPPHGSMGGGFMDQEESEAWQGWGSEADRDAWRWEGR